MRKLFEFPNGMKLVYVENSAVRSVALGVFVAAGVVTETPEISGISHFIEHMVFKGTATRSSFDIVNQIDCIGAQINAFTSKSYTCFYTVSLDTNTVKCADILSDIYFNPTFDKTELERERRVVLEEINESEDTPDDICLENLSTVFFKGHPLDKPILGNKKTLDLMTPTTLKNYMAKHYTPGNTVVSIAGNLTFDEAKRIAEEYFASKFEDIKHKERETVTPAVLNGGFCKKKKDIEQAHIAFAFPCVSFDDERNIAVQLLTSVFGTEMSSRLFQSVRERLGLCYTIFGYPSNYENNGMFVIYTSTNPESTLKAVEAIRAEIDLLLCDGISEEELGKGREQLKTSLVLGQESTSSMMRAFGRYAIQTGKLYDFESKIAKIDSLTVDDILDVAKYIFNFDMVAGSLVSRDTKCDIMKTILKKA
ncbi:MAG: pitrilysin family protein [Clostridia bacterium]